MSKHPWISAAIAASTAAVATLAHAQPQPISDPAGGTGSGSATSSAGSAAPTVEDPYATPPVAESSTAAPQPQPQRKPPPPPRPPDPEIAMPQLLSAPTGWLLPAAVLYSRTGLDTGGGFTSDQRVGLGDVAEFGVATLDTVRGESAKGAAASAIQPYVAATFRMGVQEDRLFDGQPGVVIGFRKSFDRTSDSFTTQVAELSLVASRHFGPRVALHLGGAFWDASLEGGANGPVYLHGNQIVDQLRLFGGIEVKPFDRSEILVDWAYAPEFCYQCATDPIRLTPELSWGVRYEATPWMFLESGVHVFDIDQANLLDAQIFGQVTFVTWGLRHAVDSLR